MILSEAMISATMLAERLSTVSGWTFSAVEHAGKTSNAIIFKTAADTDLGPEGSTLMGEAPTVGS